MKNYASQGVDIMGQICVNAEQMVHGYEQREVSQHPLFVALSSRPVDLSAIWFLMANLQHGISYGFVRWLARTIERVEDRRIAALLAKQLNDELGNGDPTQIHSVLLSHFVDALTVYRPNEVDESSLRPGRRLEELGDLLFFSGEINEALGALMVGEIFAKKMDRCLGDEIRRQNLVPRDALIWLELHETLEVDHADDSLELARFLPSDPDAMAAVRRGAAMFWDGLWRFLDEVQQLTELRVKSGVERSAVHATL